MMNLINPNIDVASVQATLARDGIVQIENFFDQQLAENLLNCLENDVEWDLAYSQEGKGQIITAKQLKTMTSLDVRQAVAASFDFSHSNFQFIYNTFRVIDSYLAKEYKQHYLYSLSNEFHKDEYLDFMRQLTGCPDITRMDVIVARYLPGHFLTLHDDSNSNEGREQTYILNLTKDWRPEWGGLLHITDKNQQEVIHTFVPKFNSMILFQPPRWHFVSQVSNYAKLPRYTLTGWMLST